MNPQTRTSIARTAAFAVAASITAVTTTFVPPTTASAPAPEIAPVATMADCMDPGHRPVVTTCPYPVKSGNRFSSYTYRMSYPEEYAGPGR